MPTTTVTFSKPYGDCVGVRVDGKPVGVIERFGKRGVWRVAVATAELKDVTIKTATLREAKAAVRRAIR